MGICFNQSQKILPLIESSIKKGNSNIESFLKIYYQICYQTITKKI